MKKSIFLLIPFFILVFTACLDEQETQDQQNATAEIEAVFTNAETGETLENFSFFMLVVVEGSTQPSELGEFETDAAGFISTPVLSMTEETITTIIFEYETGTEIRTVEEDVDLQLRFEEPINTVSLDVEVDISE